MKNYRKILVVSVVTLMLAMIGCSSKPSQSKLMDELQAAQESQDPAQVLGVYEKIVNYYPEGEEAAKAQFMIGYIYANEMLDTAKAREAFDGFLTNYSAVSDSQLILSAEMELKTLGMGAEAYEKMIFGEDDGGAKE